MGVTDSTTSHRTELPDELAQRFNEFLADPHDDPQPMYDELRAVGPVVLTPAGWFVTGQAEGNQVLRNNAAWSRDANNSSKTEPFALAPDDPSYARRCISAGALLWSDNPQHSRVRRMVAPVFGPRTIDARQGLVQESVQTLLDEVSRGRNEMELVQDFALPVPIRVIMTVLGIEDNDRFGFDRFVHLGHSFVALVEPNVTEERFAEADKVFREAGAFILDLAEERRRNPREDLLTGLVQARDEGESLSDEELVGLVCMLVSAGHDTTSNMIANAVYNLLRNQGQWDLLVADPSLIEAATEEALRYEATARNALPRWALEDVEVGGQMIQKGEKVIVCVHACGHDGRAHTDPHKFDVVREANPHITFGAGAHNCMGAPLARMEIAAALRALTERFPTLRIEGPVQWQPSFVMRGLTGLNVAW